MHKEIDPLKLQQQWVGNLNRPRSLLVRCLPSIPAVRSYDEIFVVNPKCYIQGLQLTYILPKEKVLISLIKTVVNLLNAADMLARSLTNLFQALERWLPLTIIKHIPLFEAFTGLIS